MKGEKWARQLAAKIEREDPRCEVTGYRSEDGEIVALDVVDHRAGYPFVVRGEVDWERRVKAAEFTGEGR